eukprot:TRINITY_DN861_c0_g1_i4.p1 TRINITY_DN861_c0_g1~~TRINITY_DN861_c0_g1_i4.p1  ORF type:complete len:264 (+),score=66.74 TRINITY_DN861_c0_g1_i4:269-1060(+)
MSSEFTLKEEDIFGNVVTSPTFLYQISPKKGSKNIEGYEFYDYIKGDGREDIIKDHHESGTCALATPDTCQTSKLGSDASSGVLSPGPQYNFKLQQPEVEQFDPIFDFIEKEPAQMIQEGVQTPMSQEMFFQMIRQMERRLKIEKFKMKKQNRLNKIKYENRQRIAENRIRIKGKFISKKETERLIARFGKEIIKPGGKICELNTDMLPYEEVLKHTTNTRRIHKGILNALKKVKKLKSSTLKISSQIMTKLKLKARIFKVEH